MNDVDLLAPFLGHSRTFARNVNIALGHEHVAFRRFRVSMVSC
jgi:hypothetical protein